MAVLVCEDRGGFFVYFIINFISIQKLSNQVFDETNK